jgi:hypothetical protein
MTGDAVMERHSALWPVSNTEGDRVAPVQLKDTSVGWTLLPFDWSIRVSTSAESTVIDVWPMDKHCETVIGARVDPIVPSTIEPHREADPLTIMDPESDNEEVQPTEKFWDTMRVTLAPTEIVLLPLTMRDPLILTMPDVTFSS